MPIVSQSIKNLKGGISQQPHLLRYPEQGTTQINGWSSEAGGLQKRSSTVFQSRVGNAGVFGSKPLVHTINRDIDERYNVVFTGTGIRIFKLGSTITEMVVHAPKGEAYITTASPRSDLRCATVADYTFITNRTKIIEKSGTTTTAGGIAAAAIDTRALVLCRGGQYGRTMSLTINGKNFSFKLPAGFDTNPTAAAQQVEQLDAQAILTKLKAGISAADHLPTPWAFNIGPGYMEVVAPTGQKIDSISVEDGFAGQILSVVRHEVSTIAKLPLEAPNNYTVEVKGDTTKTGDSYYIAYDSAQKTWKEVVGWGVDPAFKNETMPWAIRREANGEFTFHPLDGTDGFPKWAERRAGDDDTSPFPSFVDSAVNDVFLFRNRLGFLSGENIILSRTAHYFDFWPASVANLSDDDPVDVAISHNKVSILKYAVQFAEQMLLWSDQAQFVFGAQGTLTSKSVDLDLATEFEVSDYCRPLGLGRSVYYMTPRSAFSSMNRYYTVGETSNVKDSEDVSAHIPFYIPNGTFHIEGSSTEDFVSLLTENDPSKIFIYKFKFQNDQRTQLSWSHWELGTGVKIWAATVIESRVYIFAENGTDLFSLTLDLTKNTKDIPEEPYRTYLDFKKAYTVPTGTYDINSNTTKLVPHTIYGMTLGGEKDFIVVDDTGVVNRFIAKSTQWDANEVVNAEGNLEGKTLVVGFHFDFTYTFSQFLVKQFAADGSVQTLDTGRLQLRKAWVNYQDSGSFNVIVNVRNRWEEGSGGKIPKPFIYRHSGPKLNSPDSILGEMVFTSGQFQFPVPGNANEVEATIASSSVNPLSLIGAGWMGVHVGRSQTL